MNMKLYTITRTVVARTPYPAHPYDYTPSNSYPSDLKAGQVVFISIRSQSHVVVKDSRTYTTYILSPERFDQIAVPLDEQPKPVIITPHRSYFYRCGECDCLHQITIEDIVIVVTPAGLETRVRFTGSSRVCTERDQCMSAEEFAAFLQEIGAE